MGQTAPRSRRKRLLMILCGALLAAQFFQPDRSAPPVDPAQDLLVLTKPAAGVEAILRTACYDCHSNTTRYPWYALLTPVNWWMQKSHVEHARHHLNFSEWGTYSQEDRGKIAEEAMELVSEGEMPLATYTWLHGDARLSDDQRKALTGFFADPVGGPCRFGRPGYLSGAHPGSLAGDQNPTT